MNIGVVKELYEDENRVSLTPSCVKALVSAGNKIFFEKGAGIKCGFTDEDYSNAGAILTDTNEQVWEEAKLMVKVRAPVEEELRFIKKDHILFSFLHLPANPKLEKELCSKGITAIGYEMIRLPDGTRPLLIPMSEICGKLSIQIGMKYLEKTFGGRGILLSGVAGVPPAEVIIIGAGVVGQNAAKVATGLGAKVTLLDVDILKLKYVENILSGRMVTMISNADNIDKCIKYADLLIGAVLVPDEKTPVLVEENQIKQMKEGSVAIDISIDQGGCFRTSHPTSLANPTFTVNDVIHYCVPNMPSSVPRTSTFALTGATLFYILEIASKGLLKIISENSPIKSGIKILDGELLKTN